MVIMLLPIGKLNMLIIIMTWEAVKKRGGVTPPSLTITICPGTDLLSFQNVVCVFDVNTSDKNK